ncbi:zinc finger protein 518A isoform X3 [Rhinolophus sinicus]|uniref:zinc finger protein 518A isoform X3 n=1 Tax=Rhinolophus sinicus TaxID=89399 RepID=UPI003D7BB72D
MVSTLKSIEWIIPLAVESFQLLVSSLLITVPDCGFVQALNCVPFVPRRKRRLAVGSPLCTRDSPCLKHPQDWVLIDSWVGKEKSEILHLR